MHNEVKSSKEKHARTGSEHVARGLPPGIQSVYGVTIRFGGLAPCRPRSAVDTMVSYTRKSCRINPAARPSVDLCEMIGAYLEYIMVDCCPQGWTMTQPASKLMYPARRHDFAATSPRLVARAQTNSSKYWERRRACALRPRDCRGRGSNADLRATAR